ncbi:MAG: mannonate dehydratase [Verrucomicrobia bacterium]|nr:mannonate dehydratase [Verrucomicrobiota bacterium]
MNNRFTRREMLQIGALAALSPTALAAEASNPSVQWPPALGTGTPKICLGSGQADEARMRQLKQVGVDHVLMGGGRVPWTEESLRQTMDQYKAGGISVINMMIGGMNDIIHGGPNRDREIENIVKSIRAAGKAGLPVIEYNFYAHRLTEGYKEEIGRAGAGYTAYDYELSKDLPPREGVGTHTRADQLKRARYFLEAIVPEAEKANVRFALHPNDPPVPMSRGSEQIMDTVEHWKEYLDLVKSPYNGMTFDCGVTRETGADPVAVCRMLGDRDVINHVHFRNVIVRKPYVDYTEVFIDEGQVDMFAVMKELVRQKYPRGLYPEHPRALDIDRERGIRNQYPGGGGFVGEIYNVAYTKAMLQAALSS